MNETLLRALGLVAGLMFGALVYGGLWWILRNRAGKPAYEFSRSPLARLGLALVLAGSYWAGGRRWEPLLLCLLGFVAARLAAVLLAGSPEPKKNGSFKISA